MKFQSPQQQLALILYSLCIGCIVGVVYTLFKTLSIFIRPYMEIAEKKAGKNLRLRKNLKIISGIFQFSLDFLFSVVYTVVAVVFIFQSNNGDFRFFMLFFALCAFILYSVTLGALVQRVMCFVAGVVFRVLRMAAGPGVFVMKRMRRQSISRSIRRHIFSSVEKP